MSDEVNWQQLAEGFRLERNIMQEMAMKAREAGRREGLRMAEDWVGRIAREVDEHDGYLNFCASIQEEIHRVLIDSPKAEGEAAASRHGFHAACGTFHDLSICHVGAPAEAEVEES